MFDKFVAGVVWLFFVMIAYMPMPMLAFFAKALCWLRIVFSRKEKRILYHNIEKIYGIKPQTAFSRMFLEQVFSSQARITLETLRAIIRPGQLKMDGLDSLRDEMTRHKLEDGGQIVISAHLGSWELVGLACTRVLECPFHVLAKPSKTPWFNLCLEELRQRMGLGILWSQTRGLLKQMLSTLDRGEWLGFVSDQKPRGRIGPVVDFLKVPTEFVAGPASMSIRTQCGILGIFCLRKGPMHYEVLWSNVVPPKHGIEDEKALSQLVATCLEKYILLYPEQWCWNYRRWSF